MEPIINTLKNSLQEEKLYFTVKELTQKIKDLIDKNFIYFWIEGEVSNLKQAQNGHLYFNLVENEALIKTIIFKDQRNELHLEFLKEGLKVLVYGKIHFFTRSGEIFLVAKKIEPLGIGLLYLQKQKLLEKYKALFTPEIKKMLPSFPQKIAIITSLYGAALQDFLKITKERWDLHILVYPVRVQGEGAHKEIAQAIYDLNRSFPDLDLIIITRGGGSLEDLAPFYTEEIILAIRSSEVPIVSAVGHEIDVTLCDLAADKRCSTPSACAFEILPDKKELLANFYIYRNKIRKLLEIKLTEKEKILRSLEMELMKKSPLNYFHRLENFLREARYNIFQNINRIFLTKEKKFLEYKNKIKEKSPEKWLTLLTEQLRGYKKLLFSLSPYNILEKGYSIVKRYTTNEILKSSDDVEIGELLEIQLLKGKLLAKVVNKEP
ncbi:MAG: exodeoxyribonuclease VII large subunit [Caldimicrobium sp.]